MGLADLILGSQNPFTQFVAQNKNTIHGAFAGLGQGQNISDGLSNAARGAVAGGPADDAAAVAAKQEADRQAAIQQQAALRQKYAQFFLQQNQPDYARAVSDGIMEPGAAYGDWMTTKAKTASASGAFDGTGMDQQAWNIVLRGQKDPTVKSSPEYQAALSIVSQPKAQIVQGPDGNMVQVMQSPQLPAFLTNQPPAQQPAPFTPQSVGQDGGFSPALGGGSASAPQSGGIIATPIPGTGKANLTETQSKDVYFGNNADGALPILDNLGTKLTSFGGSIASDAGRIGNYFKTSDYQQAEQAGRVFINSILRKDSGAAITKEENANYGETYLPRPGDKPAVIAQKAAARRRAVAGLKAGLSPQAILALENTEKAEPAMSGGATVIDGVTIEPVN